MTDNMKIDGDIRGKITNYFFSNLLSILWSLSIFLGGIVFISYYARIGYMPDFDFVSSMVILAAAALNGLLIVISLFVILFLPGIFWYFCVWKSSTIFKFHRMSMAKLGHNSEVLDVFLYYSLPIVVFFVSFVVVGAKYGCINAILSVIFFLVLYGFLVSCRYEKAFDGICSLPAGSRKPSEKRGSGKSLGSRCRAVSGGTGKIVVKYPILFSLGTFVASLLMLPTAWIIILLMKYGDSVKVYTSIFDRVYAESVLFSLAFLVVLLSNFLIIIMNPIKGGWDKVLVYIYVIFFSVAIVVGINGAWGKVPESIMEMYRFGSFQAEQIVFSKEGCGALVEYRLLEKGGGECVLKGVKVLSRLGSYFYLEGNFGGKVNFFMKKDYVLSWRVVETKVSKNKSSATFCESDEQRKESSHG